MNYDLIISVFCIICIIILFAILKIRTGSFSLKTSTKNITPEEMEKRIQIYNNQLTGTEDVESEEMQADVPVNDVSQAETPDTDKPE